MVEATCLIAGACSIALDGDVRFLGEFFIIADAFTLGKVLNVGTLAYVTDYYGELCLLNGVTPVGNELPKLPPS